MIYITGGFSFSGALSSFCFFLPVRNGNTVVLNGARRDHVALFPAGMWVADMVAENAGDWLLKCQVLTGCVCPRTSA